MKQTMIACVSVALVTLSLISGAVAQETSTAGQAVAPETSSAERLKEQAGQVMATTLDKAEELGKQAQVKIDELSVTLDQSEQAKKVSAGLLQPIYQLAEALSFSLFHWVAFALMLAGVVGYALQLVLAKVVVLSKASLSLSEIISDAVGLAISLFGLVLTTQAAAENSTFTQSPAAVLSSTALGVLLGILLYIWGQREEVQAVRGRKEAKE